MPRFHFHLREIGFVLDREGEQLASVDAAIVRAAYYAKHMAAADIVEAGTLRLTDAIEVADEDGNNLAVVTFAEVVTVES